MTSPAQQAPGEGAGTLSDRRGYTIRALTAADLDQARAVMYRSVVEDFGSQPDPGIHADIDDLLGWYDAPDDGPFMLVAQDDVTGAIIATGGIRGGALTEGLSPGRLVRRYGDGRTGQIVRVYVLREQRRRGIARAMVQAIRDRAAAEGHYGRIVFHTLQHSPGAVAFWTSMGATLVLDDTRGVTNAMFYEFATPNGPGAGPLLQSASTPHTPSENPTERQGTPL